MSLGTVMLLKHGTQISLSPELLKIQVLRRQELHPGLAEPELGNLGPTVYFKQVFQLILTYTED